MAKKFERSRNFIKVYEFNSDTNQITTGHIPEHLMDPQYGKSILGM